MEFNALVRIESKCKDCGKRSLNYRWVPREKWDKFANTEVIICDKCGSLCDILSASPISCQLHLKGNDLMLEINGKLYGILRLFTNKIKFFMGNLPEAFNEEDSVVTHNEGKEVELLIGRRTGDKKEFKIVLLEGLKDNE